MRQRAGHFLLLRGVAGLAASLAMAMPALARDDPAGRDTETIVVTGQGLDAGTGPGAYDVVTIDRDAIAASASGRTEDVLATVAGFSQFRRSDSRSSNPSAQGVTLRALGGNASSRTVVLLDGVPVANPFFGYIPFAALAPGRLSAIRVTRGGGSGGVGPGAVAGTIEMFSAGPAELSTFEMLAVGNDRGESQTAGTVTIPLGQGFVSAGGQWDRGRGFWTTPRDQRVDATARAAYESWSTSVRAVAPLDGQTELQASILAYGDRRTLRFRGADSAIEGQQASVRVVGRGAWQFEALGYVQAQDFSNIVISSTSFQKTLDQHQTPTIAFGGKLELRPPVGEAVGLRLGSDFRRSEGHLLELPYARGQVTALRRAGGEQTVFGLYAESDWTLGPVVLRAGARADRWAIRNGFFRQSAPAGAPTRDDRFAARSDWSLGGRAGILWHAARGVDLRAAAYSAIRLPTLNELYRSFVVFPVTTGANPDLTPERLRGWEAGVDLRPRDGVALSLTAYDNRVDDAIANVTTGQNLRERRNVDAVRARGIEAGAQLAAGNFTLDMSLAWTRARVRAPGTSIDGKRPAQVPRLAGSGTLAWRPAAGWRLSATLRHLGAQYEDDLETDLLPAATTLDAVAELPLARSVTLVLRGENLTGEEIVTRNQGGSIDLGAPRTLWAGVRIALR